MNARHFKIEELVSPEIHRARGNAAWQLLDPRALLTLDTLRELFGPIVVNDWATGGKFKESGLRDFNTKTGGAFSQHKFGRAFDCKFLRATPQEVYAFILKNPSRVPWLTVLEDIAATPTWLHFDTRNHDRQGIWVVRP